MTTRHSDRVSGSSGIGDEPKVVASSGGQPSFSSNEGLKRSMSISPHRAENKEVKRTRISDWEDAVDDCSGVDYGGDGEETGGEVEEEDGGDGDVDMVWPETKSKAMARPCLRPPGMPEFLPTVEQQREWEANPRRSREAGAFWKAKKRGGYWGDMDPCPSKIAWDVSKEARRKMKEVGRPGPEDSEELWRSWRRGWPSHSEAVARGKGEGRRRHRRDNFPRGKSGRVVKVVAAVCVERCYHNRIGTIWSKVPAIPWMLSDCSH